MKKRWIIASMLAAVLVVGAVGTVLAQETDTKESPLKSFASRVAAILGIEEQQVQDAFTQAASEMRDEAVQAKLAYMVENGRLTQAQADEYYQWYQAMPEGLDRGLGPRFGKQRFHRGGHRFGFGRGGPGFHPRFGPPVTESDQPAPSDTSATSV